MHHFKKGRGKTFKNETSLSIFILVLGFFIQGRHRSSFCYCKTDYGFMHNVQLITIKLTFFFGRYLYFIPLRS